MAAKIPPRIIRIDVKTTNKKELQSIARDLGVINKNIKSTAKSASFLSGSLKGLFVGFGLRELVDSIDTFQLLGDRIRSFVGDSKIADETFNQIALAAKKTRSSVASLSEIYSRVALSTKELGLTTEQVVSVTAALQQTFRLSGATIAEATASTIQLTQGLSSGQLRGQELRSVLEQNVIFANLLSKELGITRGQLIKFAESGQITSDVVLRALSKNFEEIDRQANVLGTTIEQSLTIVFDQFRLELNKLNKSLGISKRIEELAFSIADNFDIVSSAIVGLTALIVLQSIPRIIAGFKALQIAIASNPIGFVLTALTASITYLYLNWDKAVLVMKKGWLNLRRAIVSGAREIFLTLKPIDDWLRRIVGSKPINTKDFIKDENNVLKNIDSDLEKINSEIESLDKKGKLNLDFNFQNIKIQVDSAQNAIKELNFQFKAGLLTLHEYRAAVSQIEIAKLTTDFESGKIKADEYYQSLSKIPGALSLIDQATLSLDNAIQSQSDTISLMSGIFTKTFQGIEDAMVEFATNGKFVWRDFVNALIKDIIRLTIRATVIKPILQAITGFNFSSIFSGGVGSASSVSPSGITNSPINTLTPAFSAKGNVFDRPGLSFFGEKGPEAVLPLTRGPNGDLGVSAVGGNGDGSAPIINIFNNNNSDVQTKQTTGPDGQKQIDFIISNKVKSMISSGELDRPLGTSFGIKRKGN